MTTRNQISAADLTEVTKSRPPVGALVTCTYRDNYAGKYWTGRVLAHDDPRAWTGTIAFPDKTNPPTREQVQAHMEKTRQIWEHMRQVHMCPEYWQGDPFEDTVPVAWEFDTVYFEHWDKIIILD